MRTQVHYYHPYDQATEAPRPPPAWVQHVPLLRDNPSAGGYAELIVILGPVMLIYVVRLLWRLAGRLAGR